MLEKIKARILAVPRMRRCIAILLGIAVLFTVIFIFSNSMKKSAESTSDSDAVKEVIATIIPPESDLGKKILNNVRKIAHFTEYGLLGIEISALTALLMSDRRARYRMAGKSLFLALTVAFFDETIQIFSSRGPMIADVWIDIGGFLIYSVITYLVLEALCLGRYCFGRIKSRKTVEKR